IHRHERRFAHDIDLAKPRVELERVERDDSTVDLEQILEMQIAVALAVRAALRAAREERSQRLGLLRRPLAEAREALTFRACDQRLEVREVGERCIDRGGAS